MSQKNVEVVRKGFERGSGASVDRQDATVWEMGNDRKFVRIDYFNNRDQALKAVALAQ
jgi:hypothetical protein